MSIKFKSSILGICVTALPLLITGCSYTKQNETPNYKLTVGKIQYEIKKDMSSTNVIKALGSPNLITKDKNNNTTWVYDKVSTSYVKTNHGRLDFVRLNNNDFAITAGIAAVGGAVATTGSPIFLATIATIGLSTFFSNNNNYEIEVQQKTLTLILDFDNNQKLEKFAYMYSSF